MDSVKHNILEHLYKKYQTTKGNVHYTDVSLSTSELSKLIGVNELDIIKECDYLEIKKMIHYNDDDGINLYHIGKEGIVALNEGYFLPNKNDNNLLKSVKVSNYGNFIIGDNASPNQDLNQSQIAETIKDSPIKIKDNPINQPKDRSIIKEISIGVAIVVIGSFVIYIISYLTGLKLGQ